MMRYVIQLHTGSLAIGLMLGIGTGIAVLLQVVKAPTFWLFTVGLAALEWALWTLALSLIGVCCTSLGGWRFSSRRRTLMRLAWGLNGGALVGMSVILICSLIQPPEVTTNIAALTAVDAGSTVWKRTGDDEPIRAVRVDRDVFYAAPGGDSLRMDVYQSAYGAGARRRPALVIVHGGSWRGGNKGAFAAASRAWAAQGYVVFDVAYRLAPRYRFPAAVQDVKCVLGIIDAQAGRWGIDPARKALIGRSAGAQIALIAAYTTGEEVPPSCAVPDARVQAVISYYAPTRMSYYDIIQPELSPGALDDYLGGTPETVPEAYRHARPFTWIRSTTPPTLLLHGRRDQFVRPRDATELGTALAEAGRPYAVVVFPWANHGFDIHPKGTHSRRVQHYVDAFLETYLPVSTPQSAQGAYEGTKK